MDRSSKYCLREKILWTYIALNNPQGRILTQPITIVVKKSLKTVQVVTMANTTHMNRPMDTLILISKLDRPKERQRKLFRQLPYK